MHNNEALKDELSACFGNAVTLNLVLFLTIPKLKSFLPEGLGIVVAKQAYTLHSCRTYKQAGNAHWRSFSCYQQAPHIRPLCFEKQFFFNPACSTAKRCNVLTPSSAILNLLPQLYSQSVIKSGRRK